MEQVNKKWGNVSKGPGFGARLVVYVTFYFPRNIIKNTYIKVFTTVYVE